MDPHRRMARTLVLSILETSSALTSLLSRAKPANLTPRRRFAEARHSASVEGAAAWRMCSLKSSFCSFSVSADMAMLVGNFEGDGGARYVLVKGLGAWDFRGE